MSSRFTMYSETCMAPQLPSTATTFSASFFPILAIFVAHFAPPGFLGTTGFLMMKSKQS